MSPLNKRTVAVDSCYFTLYFMYALHPCEQLCACICAHAAIYWYKNGPFCFSVTILSVGKIVVHMVHQNTECFAQWQRPSFVINKNSNNNNKKPTKRNILTCVQPKKGAAKAFNGWRIFKFTNIAEPKAKKVDTYSKRSPFDNLCI